MLLREEPLERETDLLRITALQAARARMRVEKGERDQPPQRRIDTAEIPEVRFTGRRVDELRDLAVRRLMRGERGETGDGLALEERIARQRQTERADGGIATEYRRIAALVRARTRSRRENSRGREIALQQRDGADATLGQQPVVLYRFRSGHRLRGHPLRFYREHVPVPPDTQHPSPANRRRTSSVLDANLDVPPE